MAISRVCDDLTDIILGVESAVSLRILGICEWVSKAFPLVVGLTYSPCHMISKIRVCIYLEPPSGSICQMQMHHIHLQKGQSVNLLLHEFLSLETTRLVQHDTSMLEARIIEDRALLHSRRRIKKTEHFKGLTASECTFVSHCINLDTLLAYHQFISLFLSKIRKSGNFGSESRSIHIHLDIRAIRLKRVYSVSNHIFHRLRYKFGGTGIC